MGTAMVAQQRFVQTARMVTMEMLRTQAEMVAVMNSMALASKVLYGCEVVL